MFGLCILKNQQDREARRAAYVEKLKDPRWQRKRLEVFQRDNFTCQYCFSTEDTLNVHHFYYQGEPWDVPLDALITLCECCHRTETERRPQAERGLLNALQYINATCYQIDSLYELLSIWPDTRRLEIVLDILRTPAYFDIVHALSNEDHEAFKKFAAEYLASVEKAAK